jgi:hypothetical protein
MTVQPAVSQQADQGRRRAAASELTAANVGPVVAIVVLTAHGWSAARP